MSDQREAILERLVVVAQGIPGIVLAARNKVVPSDTQLPAIIVLDGSEQADDRDPDIRPANAPRRVKMRAVLEILLGGPPVGVGTTLNGFRQLVLNAVFTDTTLLNLTVNNRSIRYIGCDTGLDMGRQLEGSMWLHIEFTYALYPGAI